MSSPRTPRRSPLVLGGLTALALGAGLAVPMAPAHADAKCSEGYDSKEFGGTAVSAQYSRSFNSGAKLHMLNHPYTPQGLAAWPNWKGTEDLLLVGMHHHDENSNRSLIYGQTAGGTYRGAAYLPVGAHVGGVKVWGKWLYVQQNTSTVRRYPLSTVRKSLTSSGTQPLGSGTPLRVSNVSTFDIHHGYLYGAKHNSDNRDRMRRWKINPHTGNLVRDTGWGPLEVPKNTQGLQVLKDTYLFSTSGGRDQRGNVYVARRGYTRWDHFTRGGHYRCFRSVAMIQELTGMNGRTYLVNESGSGEFSGADGSGDHRIHNIRRLHVGSTKALRALVW